MMNDDCRGPVELQGILADEIHAIIQYVEATANGEHGGTTALHETMIDLHDNFPERFRHRIVFLTDASTRRIPGETPIPERARI
jgi:hypothetical protein